MITNIKKNRYELNESEKQSCGRFIHVNLALKVILDCKTVESCAFFLKKTRIYTTWCD